MTDFYKLGYEQMLAGFENLAQEALQYWEYPADAQIRLLKFRENAIFSVEAGGLRRVLRIHRLGYHTDAALRSELQWMNAIRAQGINTPEVVPTREGELFTVLRNEAVPVAHQIDMISWVDGEQLGSIEEGADAQDDDVTLMDNYRKVGVLMAKLHNQAASWTRPEGFERHAWNVDGLVGDEPLWGRFWELDALTPEQVALVQRVREKVRGELHDFGQQSDRYGLIHCDFLPENLLLGDDGTISLIDFDDAGFGWHLFDMVTTLFFLMQHPAFEQIQEAFIEGYRSGRALPDEHLAMLPTFYAARALTNCGWLHTRRETETAQFMIEVALQPMLDALAEYAG